VKKTVWRRGGTPRPDQPLGHENERVAPDYYSPSGWASLEYFQLAEDIGASPLPILTAGWPARSTPARMAPADQLDEYIGMRSI